MPHTGTTPQRPWIPVRWRKPLAWGTLAVGVLDIMDAFIFFGLRGATPKPHPPIHCGRCAGP